MCYNIETVLSIKQSNASRYLDKLKIIGITVSEKIRWVYYRLRDNTFVKFPFLSMIVNEEVGKISVCKEDLELLTKIKANGRPCD
jgi:hypothetical protein